MLGVPFFLNTLDPAAALRLPLSFWKVPEPLAFRGFRLRLYTGSICQADLRSHDCCVEGVLCCEGGLPGSRQSRFDAKSLWV